MLSRMHSPQTTHRSLSTLLTSTAVSAKTSAAFAAFAAFNVLTPAVCVASVASVASLACLGCESTASGRPTSTKKSVEARPKSSKEPAQWTMVDEQLEGALDIEDDEMVVVIIDETDDVGGNDRGSAEAGTQRRERRITRSVYRMDGSGGPEVLRAPGGGGQPAMIPPMSQPMSPNMAIPSQPVAPTPPPVMLGVRMRELDPVLATHLNLSPRKASVLEDVAEELNGHAGGLRDHDVIIKVDGSDDASPSHVRKVLRSKKAGDTVDFLVLRNGNNVEVKVTLEAFDLARFHAATPARIGG